jgi:hypothetical protein
VVFPLNNASAAAAAVRDGHQRRHRFLRAYGHAGRNCVGLLDSYWTGLAMLNETSYLYSVFGYNTFAPSTLDYVRYLYSVFGSNTFAPSTLDYVRITCIL